METTTIHEALRWASSFLNEQNLEATAGEWLLRHHMDMDRALLLASLREPLAPGVFEDFQSDVRAYASGVPVQHLTGYDEFFGRRFMVNPDVLIPRPETEELIVAVLERLPKRTRTILDVGTGSGTIAITVALELPNVAVTAVDLSSKALDVAKKNASALNASVTFKQGDLLTPVSAQKFDVILSNPPYIPEGERDSLAVHVRDYEPSSALFAGVDGLDIYRRLVTELPTVMEPQGLIAFEVGATQGERVRSMLSSTFSKAETEVRYDINGKDRIVLAYGDMTT
ncbi:peptide chain release factor N(5)-glutamine methyltransferase [Shouchella shacheensis]|uniref:peptide chain release factor N(5)-glutamine methyltransferase n=1 Tax=Shouchella shacheensis TaxID=1649580 RepID=UPI0007403116|nr:peptide chain release factor N(5)-glutamine methyltransferase [Shouchella shacheensis]